MSIVPVREVNMRQFLMVCFVTVTASAAAQGPRFDVVASLPTRGQDVVGVLASPRGVVVAAHADSDTGRASVVSMTGADGRTLWRRPFPGKVFSIEGSVDRVMVREVTGPGETDFSLAHILQLADGHPVRRFGLRQIQSVSMSSTGDAVAVWSNAMETPDHVWELRSVDRERVVGMRAAVPVASVAAYDINHVFVQRLDGVVDAYAGRAIRWSRRISSASPTNWLKVSDDGKTLLATFAGDRFVVVDAGTGEELFSYDPRRADAAIAALQLADQVDAELARRKASNLPPVGRGETLTGLQAVLGPGGHVRFHDNTRLRLPFILDFDPRSKAVQRRSAMAAVIAALNGAGQPEAQGNLRHVAMQPGIVFDDGETLAAAVLRDRVVVLKRR
jgi:hypothetical protein